MELYRSGTLNLAMYQTCYFRHNVIVDTVNTSTGAHAVRGLYSYSSQNSQDNILLTRNVTVMAGREDI